MIHILVVEDDLTLNKIVCSYLNNNGFIAKGCLGAEEACDEMYNKRFELIISDIMMKGIDGFEIKTVRGLGYKAVLKRCTMKEKRNIK